jgi:hypothetical protein
MPQTWTTRLSLQQALLDPGPEPRASATDGIPGSSPAITAAEPACLTASLPAGASSQMVTRGINSTVQAERPRYLT